MEEYAKRSLGKCEEDGQKGERLTDFEYLILTDYIRPYRLDDIQRDIQEYGLRGGAKYYLSASEQSILAEAKPMSTLGCISDVMTKFLIFKRK